MSNHWLDKYNNGKDYILVTRIGVQPIGRFSIYIKPSVGEYDIVKDNTLYGGIDEINTNSFEAIKSRVAYIGFGESDFMIYEA